MKRLGWILFFLLITYFLFLIRQDIIDYLDLKRDAERASSALNGEEKNVAGLKARLNRLKSDDLIEELARTRLGLIKKGETAYKVVR